MIQILQILKCIVTKILEIITILHTTLYRLLVNHFNQRNLNSVYDAGPRLFKHNYKDYSLLFGQGSNGGSIPIPTVYPVKFQRCRISRNILPPSPLPHPYSSLLSDCSIYIPQALAGVSSIQISPQLPETDVDISILLKLARINIHCDHVPRP